MDDATAWVLHTELALEEVNRFLPLLEDAGLLGLAEQAGRTDAYFPGRVDGLPVQGTWEPVPDRDWNEAWKQGLDPIEVGALRLSPSWTAAPGDLVIDPGQAFGTGHHETTRLCLEALQRAPLDGQRVLDVGTGSGVLAIAAARLGAREVVAVDTDPLAIAAASGNAERNGVSIVTRLGPVQVAGPGPYDVVLANLDTTTLRAVADDLAARVAVPGGVLLASGVSVDRHTEAVTALRAAGLVVQVHAGDVWALLLCGPPGAGPSD